MKSVMYVQGREALLGDTFEDYLTLELNTKCHSAPAL